VGYLCANFSLPRPHYASLCLRPMGRRHNKIALHFVVQSDGIMSEKVQRPMVIFQENYWSPCFGRRHRTHSMLGTDLRRSIRKTCSSLTAVDPVSAERLWCMSKLVGLGRVNIAVPRRHNAILHDGKLLPGGLSCIGSCHSGNQPPQPARPVYSYSADWTHLNYLLVGGRGK